MRDNHARQVAKLRFISFCAAALAFVGLAANARGDSCTYDVGEERLDPFYSSKWVCESPVVNGMVADFHMDEGDWDNGFGWADACNDNLPLKRAFNALQVLRYAVSATPNCSDTLENVGFWSYCYAKNAIDELDADCEWGSRATTHRGLDFRTALHMPFFADESVVQRAGTIFHEARHSGGWCSHTSGCASGADACDPNWSSGCVGTGSGSGKGANAYTVLFMHWFATTARPEWTSPTIRDSAVIEGNDYLSNRFDSDPCFRMSVGDYLNENAGAGVIYKTCVSPAPDYPSYRLLLL